MCTTGRGMRAGQNAFSARRSMTIESLPPENSRPGRSNSAATSRITEIDSDSSTARCVRSGRVAIVNAALLRQDVATAQPRYLIRGAGLAVREHRARRSRFVPLGGCLDRALAFAALQHV